MNNKKNFYQQQIRTLKTLIKNCKQKKIDLNNPYGSEPPLIHSVIDDSMLEITKELLKHGANVNITNKNGISALAVAINHHAYATAHELLKSKADPNLGETKVGYCMGKNNPVHLLCQQQNNSSADAAQLQLLDAVLKAGATSNAGNYQKDLPLYLAAWDIERMRVLLQNNTDPNAIIKGNSQESKRTLLYEFCNNRTISQHEKKINLLLEFGANPNLGEIDSWPLDSPLMALHYCNWKETPPETIELINRIASRLVNAGAFVNSTLKDICNKHPLAIHLKATYPWEKRMTHALKFFLRRQKPESISPFCRIPMDTVREIIKHCLKQKDAQSADLAITTKSLIQ